MEGRGFKGLEQMRDKLLKQDMVQERQLTQAQLNDERDFYIETLAGDQAEQIDGTYFVMSDNEDADEFDYEEDMAEDSDSMQRAGNENPNRPQPDANLLADYNQFMLGN